jgi:hypothetical protein
MPDPASGGHELMMPRKAAPVTIERGNRKVTLMCRADTRSENIYNL